MHKLGLEGGGMASRSSKLREDLLKGPGTDTEEGWTPLAVDRVDWFDWADRVGRHDED